MRVLELFLVPSLGFPFVSARGIHVLSMTVNVAVMTVAIVAGLSLSQRW